MDDALSSSSSCSSDSGSPRGSIDGNNDCSRLSNYDGSPDTPPESPDVCLQEPQLLLSLYTNIKRGVVASLDRRDDCLVTLAEAKQSIAEAERKLARSHMKETLVLHRLQCVREEIARSRLSQANINIQRAKIVHKHLSEQPGLAGIPRDILSTLSKPSFGILETLMHE